MIELAVLGNDYFILSGVLDNAANNWWLEHPQMKWMAKLLLFLGLLYPTKTALVTKSITRQPRPGHWTGRTLDCIRPIWGRPWILNGLVNSIGLTNRGIEWWIANIAPVLRKEQKRVVVSLFGTPEELVEMIGMLNGWAVIIIAIEINVSCPNAGNQCALENTNIIIRSVILASNATRLSLILKLSVAQDAESIISVIRKMIAAVSINSAPYNKRFPNKKSPLARPGFEHLGPGGASGFSAQELVRPFIKSLVSSGIPVIGSSAWFNPWDIIRLWDAGVSAIGFGALYLIAPWLVSIYVRLDILRRNLWIGKAQAHICPCFFLFSQRNLKKMTLPKIKES